MKEFLVQQISVSDGKVFLLFHPESPVKVERLLELIHKQKNRFRLSPDGRLSFAPKNQEWEPLMDEVTELLRVDSGPARDGRVSSRIAAGVNDAEGCPAVKPVRGPASAGASLAFKIEYGSSLSDFVI